MGWAFTRADGRLTELSEKQGVGGNAAVGDNSVKYGTQ